MPLSQILESLMLLAFSVGWYCSIAKTIRLRVATGKSAAFVTLVVIGYGAGIAAKVLDALETGTLAPVTYVYAWNMTLCAADLCLVLWFNRKRPAVV